MPNHIENELSCASRILDSLRRGEGDEAREVDFNLVVPMPPILDGDCGEHINDWAKLAMGYYPLAYLQKIHRSPVDSFRAGDLGAAADALHVSTVLRYLEKGPYPKDFTDSDFAMLLQRINALRETGFVSWCGWRIKHWGTKWNAYRTRRHSGTSVRFQTAWSAPMPVVDALSRKHPSEVLTISWADEDVGANAGRMSIRNGKILNGGRFENYSREAYAAYLDLHHDGVLPDDMVMSDDGTIKYKLEPEEQIT